MLRQSRWVFEGDILEFYIVLQSKIDDGVTIILDFRSSVNHIKNHDT